VAFRHWPKTPTAGGWQAPAFFRGRERTPSHALHARRYESLLTRGPRCAWTLLQPRSHKTFLRVRQHKLLRAEARGVFMTRWLNVEEAARSGKCCACCGRSLLDGEPVWRRRVHYGHFHRLTIAPVCADCRPDWKPVYSTGECGGCGRPVHQTEYRDRARAYCCQRCEKDIEAARQRQHRTEARGPSRQCVECDETFEPQRADVRYCSNACRQKAYRKRVTLNERGVGLPFGNRNVTPDERHASEQFESRNEQSCGRAAA
jgi:hypothetical protein